MSEEGFFKSGLGAFPAIVIHHDVGTLAEAGERLVRRSRGIDTKFHCVGIGQEATAAGVCAILRDDDYIYTGHRPDGPFIAKGAA